MQKSKNNEVNDVAKITNKIKLGWIAGLVSGIMTLGATLFVISTGENIFGNTVSIYTFLDVALVFSLTFGVYKNSRFAATTLVVYFLISKILAFVEVGRPPQIMTIIFLYFYFQAMIGTYQYHKILKYSVAE